MTSERHKKTPSNASLAEPATSSRTQRLRAMLSRSASDNLFEVKPSQSLQRDPFRLAKYASGLLLGIGAIVWGGMYFGHWFTTTQTASEVQSNQPTKAVPKTQQAVTASSVKQAESQVASIPSTLISDGQTRMTSATSSNIDPNAILAAPMPQDSAIAKEEIDRLDDQFLQLSEQEALLQAQLSVMDTLEDKKAERIRLLEQQIALLEQQKATPPTQTNKSPADK